MAYKLLLVENQNLLTKLQSLVLEKLLAGVRFNIIPESAELIGTVRTLDPKMKMHIMKRMTRND